MGRWSIPKGWSWAKAIDIATIVGGGTPSTKNPANFTENGIPWITPADLSNYKDEYISRGSRDLSEGGYNSSGAQLMPENTVLFTSRAPVGYCALAANEICTNQGFKSLVLRGAINSKYIRHYLLYSKEYAESLASGSTFKELSGKRMATLEFPIPPLNEQKRIVAKIEKLQARSRRAQEALEAIPGLLEQLRQSVLSAAFRGELTKKWREKRNLPASKPGSYFVFVLKCADGSNYIGITEDLERRWEEHRSGKGSQWTQKNHPQYVLHWEEHDTRQSAAKREKWLKTGFGRKWIKREEKSGRLRQAGNIEPAAELLKRIRTERRKRWEADELDKLKAKGLTGDKLDAEFAKRRKQYKEPPPVDTTGLPELPEGWCWEKLDNVCAKIMDGAHHSPPNGPSGDWLYITAKNIKPWKIDLNKVTYVSAEDHNKIYPRCDVKYNDILYVKDGVNTGMTALNVLKDPFSLLSSVGVFRPERGLHHEYLVVYLNSPLGHQLMLSMVSGNAITRLTLTKLKESFVPIPPVSEQEIIFKIIASFFQKLDSLKSQFENKMLSLSELDQAILRKAFRGKLVPQDPNDESASILLKRISLKNPVRQKGRRRDLIEET